jgi:hypothetical protein
MSQSHPSGLLTDHEREILTGDHPDADTQRDGVLEAVSTRLPDALVDLMSLYLYLDDDELETVMTGGAESSRSFRAPAQYAYAALYTGLQLTGDDPEHRLVSAIKQAEAAHQRHAQVDLSITTEPFLPPEDRLAALERGDGDRVSIEALEHLFFDSTTSANDFADALSEFNGEEVSPETIRAERQGAAALARPPVAVLTDVEISEVED